MCTTTLYRYIDDQRLEIRNIDLVEKANRRTKQHKSTKHKRLAGCSMEERPKAVERRKQFGHWEMDTVVGKRNGRESVILSLIERKTRCQLQNTNIYGLCTCSSNSCARKADCCSASSWRSASPLLCAITAMR